VVGKEEGVSNGVWRSGPSAQFDVTGVEDEACKEDAEYFPWSVVGSFLLRRLIVPGMWLLAIPQM